MPDPLRIIAPQLTEAVRAAIDAGGIPLIVHQCVNCDLDVGTAPSSQDQIRAGAELWCHLCAIEDGWEMPAGFLPELEGAYSDRLRAFAYANRNFYQGLPDKVHLLWSRGEPFHDLPTNWINQEYGASLLCFAVGAANLHLPNQ